MRYLDLDFYNWPAHDATQHMIDMAVFAATVGVTVKACPNQACMISGKPADLVKVAFWDYQKTAGGGPSFNDEDVLDAMYK